MYHEDIFYPFLHMFSTFDRKMENVVENAECFYSEKLGGVFKLRLLCTTQPLLDSRYVEYSSIRNT